MNAGIKRLVIAALLTGAASPAWADGLIKVEQTVFGMDCAPCAYGAQKNLSKLPGVAKVEVTMNDGIARIEFSPDSSTTLAQIRNVLINGGLTPKEAMVTVEGRIARAGNKLQLIAGDGQQYDLVMAQAADAASLAPDTRVIVQGQVAEGTAGPGTSLTVQSIKPATEG